MPPVPTLEHHEAWKSKADEMGLKVGPRLWQLVLLVSLRQVLSSLVSNVRFQLVKAKFGWLVQHSFGLKSPSNKS